MKFSNKVNKGKKANIQILRIHKKGKEYGGFVKTFGFCLNYNRNEKRIGMYKEIKATTETEAIRKLFSDMAGKHKAKVSNIQITSFRTINKSQTRRLINKQLNNELLSFRYPFNLNTIPRQFRNIFKSKNTIKTKNISY